MIKNRFVSGIALAILLVAGSMANAANITWNITYDDVVNGTGVGFDDAALGATRRATISAVTSYINSVIDASGPVDVRINNS